MGGNARWLAAAIRMDNGGKIMMDSGSSNGQQWRNGQQDGEAIAMGNGMVAAQWMAQWDVDDCLQSRSSAMGGDARWMAEAIMMDGGGVIAMDTSSGDGQRQQNGQLDGKAIVIGNGMAAAQWTAQ
jgi:hypothetical protein